MEDNNSNNNWYSFVTVLFANLMEFGAFSYNLKVFLLTFLSKSSFCRKKGHNIRIKVVLN